MAPVRDSRERFASSGGGSSARGDTGSLSRIIAKYQRRLVTFARTAIAEAVARVLARTPVDTGAARRSWTLSQAIESIGIGDVFRLFSTIAYMPALEFAPYHSRQAPRGMVRITAAEWPEITGSTARAVVA